MTLPKHTPKPWFRNGHTVFALTPYTGKPFRGGPAEVNRFSCHVSRDNREPDGAPDEELEANACLIEAAPETAAERDRLREVNAELLEALKVMVEYTDQMDGCEDWPGIYRAAKDAIAKAEKPLDTAVRPDTQE